VLTTSVVFRASADQAATAAKPQKEKTHTGTVTAVDPKEHVICVNGWLANRKFNLGESCTYTLQDKNTGTINDLRPGQKVMVAYQNARGVLVANRVEQIPMRHEGTVKAIDADKRKLTLHMGATTKEFALADDTKVTLRKNKSGTLADIQPGHYVTVLYETPGDKPTARQIAQTSETFSGSLTAIDLSEKTLKARGTFGSRKFNVANNCTMVLNGKTDAQLRDLKPGDQLVFSYDEIDGVNVVNRITTETATPENVTVQTSPAY
jgi:Cu/Ag efflux protein CusF